MTRKTTFSEGFNNLGLALGMTLKFHTSVANRLKLKVRKLWKPILTFVEVAGEKLVGGLLLPPPILNRVKDVCCLISAKTKKNIQNSKPYGSPKLTCHVCFLEFFSFLPAADDTYTISKSNFKSQSPKTTLEVFYFYTKSQKSQKE